MIDEKRLKLLCDGFNVSSEENSAREILKESFEASDGLIQYDRLGSIMKTIPSKKKNALKVLIASPLDQIGFMIDEIFADGTLGFTCLESLSKASLLHQVVMIQTRSYEHVLGVIVDEGNKYAESALHDVSKQNLKIKVGLKKEEINEMIHIGDLVTLHTPYFHLSDDVVCSSHLTSGVLNEILIEVYERMKDVELPYDLVFAGIGQSTIGYRGTKTITHVIQPNMAIALALFDGKKANDGASHGCMYGVYDKAMLPSRILVNDVCKKIDVHPYSSLKGNDGSFIHKTQKGAPCISLGLLVSNLFTGVETCSLKDVEEVVDQICKYLTTLDEDTIKQAGFMYED